MAKRQPTTNAVSRRVLLAWSAGAAAVYGSARWSSAFAAPDQLPRPPLASRSTPLYLTAAEAAFVDAAVSRLIPPDETGPGAVEAGVTVFIDSQLAGAYGKAADWYMQGPFEDGNEQQGYQSPLTPAQLYRAAIAAIDEHSHAADGKAFAQLNPAQRDRWLHDLEDGKVELGSVSAKTFFTLLWQNTQEGISPIRSTAATANSPVGMSSAFRGHATTTWARSIDMVNAMRCPPSGCSAATGAR